MKQLLLFVSFLYAQNTFSQLLINGVDFISTVNSIVYVNTDSLLLDNNANFIQNGLVQIDKDLIVESGNLQNDGEINVEENVLINDQINGLTTTSQFFVAGNWTNNNTFNSGQSTVTLNGTTQDITGTQVTGFYNLNNIGLLADRKQLVGVNASVSNVLDLGDVEFATNEYNLSVLNTDVNSILRNDGFVSSLDTGKLERATNTTNEYLFPTGSTDGITRYRPLIIAPNANTANTFGARLANLDATLEDFDVLNLGDSLCAVNPNFYHRIYSERGSGDITMNYIASLDGEWNTMANWQQTNLWDKLANETQGNNAIFSTITSTNVSDYSEPAFALAQEKPTIDLDDQITINSGETAAILPIYSGGTPLNIIWTPVNDLTCANCLETEASPLETTSYIIEISVSPICSVLDSILVLVNLQDLEFPTAFSPNADGVNDTFRPVTSGLIADYEISIYNRWGNLVYTSTNPQTGWDGTYENRNAPIEVYSYYARYKYANEEEVKNTSGNLTLIR